MKRHSHVQSGLAISDGRWVMDLSYNIGLDPCSRKSPLPCLTNTFAARLQSSPLPVLSHTTTITITITTVATVAKTRRCLHMAAYARAISAIQTITFWSFLNERPLKPRWCLGPQNLLKGCVYLFAASQVLARSRPASVDSRINCASRRSKQFFGLSLDTLSTPAAPDSPVISQSPSLSRTGDSLLPHEPIERGTR